MIKFADNIDQMKRERYLSDSKVPAIQSQKAQSDKSKNSQLPVFEVILFFPVILFFSY
jgi:hypothetical protein